MKKLKQSHYSMLDPALYDGRARRVFKRKRCAKVLTRGKPCVSGFVAPGGTAIIYWSRVKQAEAHHMEVIFGGWSIVVTGNLKVQLEHTDG